MMSPVFSLRTTADFLIKGWFIDSYVGLTLTIILIVIIAMVFEGLQTFRYMHLRARALRYTRCCVAERKVFAFHTHIHRTLLHITQVTIGYLLMLCAMSYNTWIFIGTILGAALGYQFIRPVVLYRLEQKQKRELESLDVPEGKAQFLKNTPLKDIAVTCTRDQSCE